MSSNKFKSIEDLTILEANNELKKLIKDIKYYDDMYYNKNKSLISDAEYDKLRLRLNEIENKYPILKSNNSIANKIGSPVNCNKFLQVEHSTPMLSLANTFNKEDVYKFIEKAKKYLKSKDETFDYCFEQKIDGVSLSIIYNNGKLYKASTRGDGYIGEDVTNNVLQIKDIPQYIGDINGELEVRGEIYMPISTFNKLNNKYINKCNNILLNNDLFINSKKEKFSTTRNAASGSLRQLDPLITASRNLRFFAYYISSNNNILTPKTQIEVLELLKKLKFNVCDYEHGNSIEQFIDYCNRIQEIRRDLDYEIDGTVLKINSLEIQNKLGFVGRNPRHSVAYKFPAVKVVTSIKDIEVNVGRTGKLTPVAILLPVNIQGSIISKVTLHNFNEIINKKLAIGDEIIIEKSGDVIPKIVCINNKKNNNPIHIPSNCPYCGTELVKMDNYIDIFCPNHYSCPEQVVRYIIYFASKQCFDIEGLGSKQVNELYNMSLIESPIDIFKLENNQDINILLNKDGWGDVSVKNLLIAINRSKEITLSKFITALGINDIGGTIAIDIANYYKTIDNFINTNQKELLNIKKLGEKRINTILHFINNAININFIKELKKYIKIV